MKRKKKDILSRKSPTEKIIYIFVSLFMLCHCSLIIYIYFYGFNGSLRSNGAVFDMDPNRWAFMFEKDEIFAGFEPNFKNYLDAFKMMEGMGNHSFINMLINSIWYAVGGTLFSLSVASISTYVVAKYKNKFTKLIFSLCLFLMIFPVVGSGPSLYKLYKTLGFDQTPLILLSGLNNMCHLMMYAFFSALSWTYAEAAFIDGANDFQVFFKIMLPMALPSISVLLVSGVIASWNDYTTPMLYLDKEFPTLASGLMKFETLMSYEGGNKPVYLAGVCLAMIPPIILFSVMQNTIMSKVYFGGLKG